MTVGDTKTNVDAIIGRSGVVKRGIGKNTSGIVRIGNEEWRVRSKGNINIREGDMITVIDVTGESHMERRHIDTGNLFVTNKRAAFVGSSKSIDFTLNKVFSVEPFSDSIGVSRSNKQKTEYFVGGFDGLTIKAVIEGAIKNI